MILESIDEIRAQGVAVYDYRTQEEKAQPLDVSLFTVPDWARYIAADANRSVFAYEQRPEQSRIRNDWILIDDSDCRLQRIGTIDLSGIDWRKTLTAVNQEHPHVIEDDGVVVTWDERNKRYVATMQAHGAHCASIGATRDEAIANLKAYAARQQPLDVSQFNVPLDICWGHEEPVIVASKDRPIADTPRWHRCNFEQRDTGIVFCDGDHERSESCLWQPLTAQHVEVMAKRLAADDVTVPAAQIAIGADAIPADVAAALSTKHSAAWCERLCSELSALLPEPQSVLAWQLSQLSADDLGPLARQLAQADAGKANLFAEALWSEAMDAEHARVQADDDDMAQLRVAQ